MPAVGGRKRGSETRGDAPVLVPRALVPCARVADVPIAVAFYQQLGFAVAGRTTDADGVLVWVILEHEGAQLMLARASDPVIADEQAVLFYVYYQDAEAAHAALTSAGVDVSPIAYPSHSPRGEFRVADPDGYTIQITHT